MSKILQNLPSESDEFSLLELFQKIIKWIYYLKTYWFKILVIGLLGGILGFYYASIQPIFYTAKTVFIVEEGKSSSSGLGGLASLAGQFGIDVGGNSGGGLFSGDNILLYFKSNSLAREVLLSKYDDSSKQSIADVYAEIYELKEKWSKNKKIGKVSFPPLSSGVKYSRLQDSLLFKLTENLIKTEFNVIKTDKKAGFIEVSTIMENELLAKKYCEKIVNLAVDKYVSLKIQRQKSIVDKLQYRVDSISRLLNLKTSSGAALQTSSSTMDINPLYRTGTAIAVETTVRDKTVLASIFATITQNLEMAKFNLSQETPLIQIIDSPILPLGKIKTSRLKMAIMFSISFGLLFVSYLILRKAIGPYLFTQNKK